MEQSILKSTKKILGVGDDDESFDLDIITHINSAFSVLTDLGVGPEAGFVIEDADVEWDSYLTDDPVQLSRVKTCVYMRTRLLFDPPTVSYLLEAAKEILRENEWRLNATREATEWVDPAPPVVVVDSDPLF
jgi:hypothetical protein